MNDLKRKFIEVWGDSLIKISPSLIRGYLISSNTKNFLLSIGLPGDENDLINFYTNPEFHLAYKHLNDRYIVIGDDFGTKICIDEKSDEIFSVDDREELPTRFINSNIEFLLAFLVIYKSHLPLLEDATDDEAVKIVKKMKKVFREIDSKALKNEENWWPLILEQIEDGLM